MIRRANAHIDPGLRKEKSEDANAGWRSISQRRCGWRI